MSDSKLVIRHNHLQPAQYESWLRKINDPDWYEHRYRDSMDRAMVSAIRELVEVREIATELYDCLEAAVKIIGHPDDDMTKHFQSALAKARGE